MTEITNETNIRDFYITSESQKAKNSLTGNFGSQCDHFRRYKGKSRTSSFQFGKMFFPIEHSFDLDHLPDELTDSLFAGVIEQTPKQKVIQAPHNARHPVKTQKIDHPENKNVCPNRTPTTTVYNSTVIALLILSSR